MGKRKAFPTNSQLADERKRVPLSKDIIGITIKNHRLSNGSLFVGVNSDDAVEEVLPGQEFSIGGLSSGNDVFVFDDTFFTVDWDPASTIRKAFMLIIKDLGEIKC